MLLTLMRSSSAAYSYRYDFSKFPGGYINIEGGGPTLTKGYGGFNANPLVTRQGTMVNYNVSEI